MKKITMFLNDTCVRLNLPGDRPGEIIITDKRGQEHSFPFAECELTDVDDLFTWSPPNQYVPEARLNGGYWWDHFERLKPRIEWKYLHEAFRWIDEYNSGALVPTDVSHSIGARCAYGTIIAVHCRPEADK